MFRNKVMLWMKRSSNIGTKVLIFSVAAALYSLGSINFVTAASQNGKVNFAAAEGETARQQGVDDAYDGSRLVGGKVTVVNPADGIVRLRNTNKVTYKLKLKNFGDSPFLVNGKETTPILAFDLSDALRVADYTPKDGELENSMGSSSGILSNAGDSSQLVWSNGHGKDIMIVPGADLTITFTMTLKASAQDGESFAVAVKPAAEAPGLGVELDVSTVKVTIQDRITVVENSDEVLGNKIRDGDTVQSGAPVLRTIRILNDSVHRFRAKVTDKLAGKNLEKLFAASSSVKIETTAGNGTAGTIAPIPDGLVLQVPDLALAPGKSATITYTVTAYGSASGWTPGQENIGEVIHRLTFSPAPGSGEVVCDSCSGKFNVATEASAVVSAAFEHETVAPGAQADLRVAVKNTDREGKLPLQHLIIDLSGLKDSFKYVGNWADKGLLEVAEGELGKYTWQVGHLDPGQSALLRLTLKAKDGPIAKDIRSEGRIVVSVPEGFTTNCTQASTSRSCRPAVTVTAEGVPEPPEGGADALKDVGVSVIADRPEAMPGEDISYIVRLLDSSVVEAIEGAVVRLDLSSITRSADFKPMVVPFNQGSIKEIASGIWEWTLGDASEQTFSFAVKVKDNAVIGAQLTAKLQSIRLRGDDSVVFVTKDTCREIFAQGSQCSYSVGIVEDSRPDPQPGINGLAIRVYVGDTKTPRATVRQGDTISYWVTAKNNSDRAISDTVIEDNLQNIIGSADIVEDSLVGFVYDKNNKRVTWPKIAVGVGPMDSYSSDGGADVGEDEGSGTSNFIKPEETLELTYKIRTKDDAKAGTEISNKVSTVPLAAKSASSLGAGASNCMQGSIDTSNCSATVTIASAAAPPDIPDEDEKSTTVAYKGKRGLASTGFNGQHVITASLVMIGVGGGLMIVDRRKRRIK